jgi:purine catabolism regulator
VAITVADLISIPYLGTTVRAGARGLDRRVAWAHSCEIADPWNWLDEGDLLMTNGYSIPADAQGQVAFLDQLGAAGISAIAIGDKRQAPLLTPEALAAADALDLPVLSTAYEVPFTALARAVAAASLREEQARLTRTVRLYDRLRELTAQHAGGRYILDCIGDEIRSELHVVDLARRVELLPASPPLPAGTIADVVGSSAEPAPVLKRVTVGERTALIVPVPSGREAALVAVTRGSGRPHLSVLQHTATIAALQVERLIAAREEDRRLGSELLRHLIDGKLESGTAQHELSLRRLNGRPLAIVACSGGGGPRGEALHHELTDREVGHLLLVHGEALLICLPDEPTALAAVRDELGPHVQVGVSDPFVGVTRVPDAAREAVWALEAAQTEGAHLVRYGDDAPLFMPRTLGEAELAVRRVLGPVIDYDAEHGTTLVQSLQVFLECNRSWQRASRLLFVHKQTLVYRVRRIEELTGRRLDDIGAVAELWLALRARELGREVTPAPGEDSLPD